MTGVPFDTFDRRSGLGASELPALVGSSPWSTPATVWLDKMGLATARETDGMRAGRDLESTVLRMAARQADARLVGNRMTFPHPDFPTVPLYATPDGFALPGRSALVECKVVGHRFDDWKGGPPDYVQHQVQGQLACLPRVGSAIVAALIGGEVKTWRLDRDQAFQARLPDVVAAWWADHVAGDRAPDPATVDDRWALLRVAVRDSGRAERIATPDEQALGAELRDLQAQAVNLDAAIQDRRLTLAEMARDSDVLGLGWRATWAGRSTIDWRSLAADLGIGTGHIAAHTRSVPTFVFRQRKDGAT